MTLDNLVSNVLSCCNMNFSEPQKKMPPLFKNNSKF